MQADVARNREGYAHLQEKITAQKRELGTAHCMDGTDKKLLARSGHVESHLVFTASSIA